MNETTWKRIAQLIVVLLCALTLKLYYSTASVNELRWILAPTTFLVGLVSRTPFEFESHAGYITTDRSFIIAASCAGVNFLITSFLMVSIRKLWRDRSQKVAWGFLPTAALIAYLATLVANTVRISLALRTHVEAAMDVSWLRPGQVHRLEGIFIYFGFLFLLFLVTEKANAGNASGLPPHPNRRGESGLFRRSLFPLLVYYATTLGIPLANGAFRKGFEFWEHSLFVLLTPLLLILPLAMFRVVRDQRTALITRLGARFFVTSWIASPQTRRRSK